MGFFDNLQSDSFSVNFQRGVEFVNNDANNLFKDCVNFNSNIRIPESIEIGDYMFDNCIKFNSNVIIDPYCALTSMVGMFNNVNNFDKNINIPYYANNISGLVPHTNYASTIRVYSAGLNEIGNFANAFVDYQGNFNVVFNSEPISMSNMFRNCVNLNKNINVPVSATDVSYMFYGCTSLDKNIRLHQRVNAAHCFEGCVNLNSNSFVPGTANVSYMFSGCTSLNYPLELSIQGGNTASEQSNNICGLLNGCSSFNSTVTFDNGMLGLPYVFKGCTNLDLPMSLPTNMVNAVGIFEDCVNYTQPVSVGNDCSQISHIIANTQVNNFTFMGKDYKLEDTFQMYDVRSSAFSNLITGTSGDALVLLNFNAQANVRMSNGDIYPNTIEAFLGANTAVDMLGNRTQPMNLSDYTTNFHDGKGGIDVNWTLDTDHLYTKYYDYPNASGSVPEYYINLYLI